MTADAQSRLVQETGERSRRLRFVAVGNREMST